MSFQTRNYYLDIHRYEDGTTRHMAEGPLFRNGEEMLSVLQEEKVAQLIGKTSPLLFLTFLNLIQKEGEASFSGIGIYPGIYVYNAGQTLRRVKFSRNTSDGLHVQLIKIQLTGKPTVMADLCYYWIYQPHRFFQLAQKLLEEKQIKLDSSDSLTQAYRRVDLNQCWGYQATFAYDWF